jgi:type 1 fimbriae regulatory protein FimB/type 1 fimbriae regulatory protein FimE
MAPASVSFGQDFSQFDLQKMHGTIAINRLKNGAPSVHPLSGRELRALRRLQRESNTSHVFTSERGGPMANRTFFDVIRRAAKLACHELKVHPHMLRHSAGYKLANQGVDTRSLAHYLGHRSLNSTARYTALASDRFKGWWKD